MPRPDAVRSSISRHQSHQRLQNTAVRESFIIAGCAALAVTSGSTWCTRRREACEGKPVWNRSSLLGFRDFYFAQSPRFDLQRIGVRFAGARPRQQYRSRSSRPEEENAARRCASGNEATPVLREAIRESDPAEGRGGASRTQACPQAGGAGRAHCRPAEQTSPDRQNRRSSSDGFPQFYRPTAMRRVDRSW